jgi:hypothetical protein
VGDPTGQDACLAGARTRDDEERTASVLHRRALRGIEVSDELLESAGG